MKYSSEGRKKILVKEEVTYLTSDIIIIISGPHNNCQKHTTSDFSCISLEYWCGMWYIEAPLNLL